MASSANAYSSHMKRQGQFNPPNNLGDSSALRFAGRKRVDSFHGSDSSDSFDIPSPYARQFALDEAKYSEEKAAVPSSAASQVDTASLNSQRTRKRDKVWSFLSGKREAQPSPATPFSVPRPDGHRRWSLPEQPSAQKESKRQRLGNLLLKPFRSRGNSQPPTPSRSLNWLSQLEDRALESSLSMALSSSRGFETETPPTSNNDRRTSL